MVAERTLELEREIAERKTTGEKLLSVNNSLRMLTDCNQAILREKTSGALMLAACRIVVQAGGYRMAWIGRAGKDEAGTIEPVARSGQDDGYFSEVRLSWSDSRLGSCPEGRAIRSGKAALCANTETDLGFTPWRSAAKKRGFGSILALPLPPDQGERAVFAVYAGAPDAFPAKPCSSSRSWPTTSRSASPTCGSRKRPA